MLYESCMDKGATTKVTGRTDVNRYVKSVGQIYLSAENRSVSCPVRGQCYLRMSIPTVGAAKNFGVQVFITVYCAAVKRCVTVKWFHVRLSR